MNYIEQIKGFWRSHDVEAFPPNAIALYFYLTEVNNKASWIASFKRNNSKICADLGISYPTLNNSRNRLKQAGLIDFKTQNGNANVTYTLKNFLKVTDEVANEVTDEVANEVGSRLFKSKDKLKQKTKTKTISSDAAASVEKKETTLFWKKFVEIWFEVYKKQTGAEPSFLGADAKNLKSIVNRLKKMTEKINQEWNEERAMRVFRRFLDNALKDDWLKANFLISILSTKFDQIINQPKNGNSNNHAGNHNTGYKAANINTTAIVRELTDDFENGDVPGQY